MLRKAALMKNAMENTTKPESGSVADPMAPSKEPHSEGGIDDQAESQAARDRSRFDFLYLLRGGLLERVPNVFHDCSHEYTDRHGSIFLNVHRAKDALTVPPVNAQRNCVDCLAWLRLTGLPSMQLNITDEHEKTILALAARIKGSRGGRMKAANKRAKASSTRRNGKLHKKAA